MTGGAPKIRSANRAKRLHEYYRADERGDASGKKPTRVKTTRERTNDSTVQATTPREPGRAARGTKRDQMSTKIRSSCSTQVLRKKLAANPPLRKESPQKREGNRKHKRQGRK